MDSLCGNREDEFFDAREELSSVSDWDSDCSEDCSSSVSYRLRYAVWAEKFGGVLERRRMLLKWMGLSSDSGVDFDFDSDLIARDGSGAKLDVERVRKSSGAGLRTSDFGEEISSTESGTSSSSSIEGLELMKNGVLVENFTCKVSNFNAGLEQGQVISRLCMAEEFQRVHGLSHFVKDDRYSFDLKKKVKRGWLRKLGVGMCSVDMNGDATVSPGGGQTMVGSGVQRVQVHPYKKRAKELSSLHAGQEIRAHQGSILTMKFSLDGQYLASAGEDGIVRVWEVNEKERSSNSGAASDPSCHCFSIDHRSGLEPLDVDKEKHEKEHKLKRSDSVCVIYPPKVFNILDKPLHEFQGHSGEVLDLSWSRKGFLLSSSIDKTVRLWQVGCDRCLRVFLHNNFVTCVDFNPLDDNYFISGSIDGKVRIWEVRHCRVVDYIDVREIVTAVSYRPDGKGGIVGSMTGTCLFYNIVDNRLQLDAQICLTGKKKSPGKRITGFEFTPDDPSKVMITSADSLVRIVCGNNVIFKFKGLRNTTSRASASFMSDGKHIVSATEDSNVYIWNYNSQEKTSSRKKSIWPSERFLSHNASIAIPWRGSKVTQDCIPSPTLIEERQRTGLENNRKHLSLDENLEQKGPLSSPDCFSLTGFLESLPRGTATWPEEKLTKSSPMAISPTMRSSKFKFLRSALQSMSGSPHMWGLVVVTAGWDGRIRTFLNYGLPLRL